MNEKQDWLFGFIEDAGLGEVVYAEDDGKVIIDKRAAKRALCVWCLEKPKRPGHNTCSEKCDKERWASVPPLF